MQVFQRIAKPFRVALRKESVDRNSENPVICIDKVPVALRKESVDRNGLGFCHHRDDVPVALRKESVDRNFFDVSLNYKEVLSLSARRAWIEIIRVL